MRFPTNAMRLGLALLLSGCFAKPPAATTAPVPDYWPQSVREVPYDPTVRPGFDSPSAVTSFLEKRWPLASIRAYCIPQRRHNGMYQNLVLDTFEAWKGRLYVNQPTGFDRISWYASVVFGHVQEYSLGVSRGKDYWLLEIGSPASATQPANVNPDPNSPWFVGNRL